MKLLKLIFIIGCIPLVLGDIFIVVNFIKGPVIPPVLVLVLVCLGLIGIICGIAHCRPLKIQDENK